MKIVNRETFLTLPAGTVYAEYWPVRVSNLAIKGDTQPLCNDFVYDSLAADSIEQDGSEDYVDKMFLSAETGVELEMDFNYTGREGSFKTEQLYAVLSKDDVKKMIARLQETLTE